MIKESTFGNVLSFLVVKPLGTTFSFERLHRFGTVIENTSMSESGANIDSKIVKPRIQRLLQLSH
jgi:hypothetical protein